MAKIHVVGAECPGCNKKLEGGHPMLAEWFHKAKAKFPGLHISWVFRNEAEQNEAIRFGRSRSLWPTSRHNHMKNGKPYATAMDLFEIRDGVAYWGDDFYKELQAYFKSIECPLEWGGSWKTPTGRRLGDYNHWQIPHRLLL